MGEWVVKWVAISRQPYLQNTKRKGKEWEALWSLNRGSDTSQMMGGGGEAENSLRVSLWIKMLLCLIKLPEKPEPAGNENFKRMR